MNKEYLMLVKMLKVSREGERNWVVEGIQLHFFSEEVQYLCKFKIKNVCCIKKLAVGKVDNLTKW